MSPDKLQVYQCRIHLILKLAWLEDEYQHAKGNRTKQGKDIAKIKRKIAEIDQDLKGMK